MDEYDDPIRRKADKKAVNKIRKSVKRLMFPPIHSPLFSFFAMQVNHAEIFAYRSDSTTSIITA